MRALTLERPGDAGLVLRDGPSPTPAPHEVRIDVAFSSINPVDLETVARKNKPLLPVRTPFVPGVDIAGTVSAVGDAVSHLAVGDRVVAYRGVPNPGAWASEICVDGSAACPVPESVALKDAAALALAGLAAWTALEALGLQPGQRVLVHGAAGAVGGAAMQLALDRGLNVLANVHSRDADRVQGAEHVVHYDQNGFESVCEAHRPDGVVDTVGGDTYKRSLRVGATALASLSAVPAPQALREAGFSVPFWMAPLLSLMAAPKEKRGVRIHPIVTRPDARGLTALMGLCEAGRLRPRIAETMTLEDVPAASAALRSGALRGKVAIAIQEAG